MLEITGKAWESFRTRVMGVDAPPDQVQEMEMAFYAGWAALFGELKSDLPDDLALARLQDIEAELEEYGRLMLKRQHEATLELAAEATAGTFGAN